MIPHSELMATLAARTAGVNPADEGFLLDLSKFRLVDRLG